MHGKSAISCNSVCSRRSTKPVQEPPEPVLTPSETWRRDAVCLGSHSTAVHRQGRPDVELGSTSKDIGRGTGFLASWLREGPGLWPHRMQFLGLTPMQSGKGADLSHRWQSCLPLNLTGGRRGRTRGLPAARPTGHPSPGTKAAGPPGTLSLLQRGQSQMQPAPRKGYSLSLCSGGLSPPPSHSSHPDPKAESPTPVSCLLRLAPTREHW